MTMNDETIEKVPEPNSLDESNECAETLHAEQIENDECADDSTDNSTCLTNRIEELETENAAINDRLLRTIAEQQNLRRRASEDRNEYFNQGQRDAASQLLSVLDNMERSLEALSDDSSSLESIQKGIDLTLNGLKNVLNKLDVHPIATEGEMFNPRLHEAFGKVETTDITEGIIVLEIERGYTVGDKVLRPSKVKVASKPEPDTEIQPCNNPSEAEDGDKE